MAVEVAMVDNCSTAMVVVAMATTVVRQQVLVRGDMVVDMVSAVVDVGVL